MSSEPLPSDSSEICAGCGDFNFVKYLCEEESLGFLCKTCWKEWLLEEYINEAEDQEIIFNGRKYKSPARKGNEEFELAPVKASREEIQKDSLADKLKPGDHIMWFRLYFWHHAIVENISDTVVSLIHFSKTSGDHDGNIIVTREEMDVARDWDTLYLVTYDDQVIRYNPSELVIARAKASIGMNGYDILKNNCENFATFLKSGISANQESQWFVQKMREILRSFWQLANFKFVSTMFKAGAAEMLELETEEQSVTRSVEAIGAGVIVAFEGGICMWNLGRLYQNFSEASKGSKRISRKHFIENIIGLISKKFLVSRKGANDGSGMTSVGTVECPGLGTVEGVVLGIIGGCVGAAIAHIMGANVGHLTKSGITSIKMQNQVVSLEDIHPGDHIIWYGNMYNPRCHGIVVRVHQKERQIIIIRYTSEKGVMLDALYYTGYDPLFKVTYPEDAHHYSAKEIVERALKAVVENDVDYENVRNNCKHFAYGITLKV